MEFRRTRWRGYTQRPMARPPRQRSARKARGTAKNSRALLRRAERVIPGGVNSPVRAYAAVGGAPPFLARGKGAYVWDADGTRYVDYVGSWGPLILGHAHPAVLRAVTRAAARGTSFGAPTAGEVEIAETICAALPSVEMVRFVSSGTEATMSAIRLARAATGRKKILKFEGCYHGHADALLVGAGSGVATLGIPGSPGVPEEFVRLTVQAPYNDVAALEDAFRGHGPELACVIVEPVAGNMGCVPPVRGFLEELRELCDRHGALLVFDEVMTGFRVARGGYQELCGVPCDLVTLGKVIGGGLPIGAYGGRADLMSRVSPAGDVYQAGTLSGNPLAVAAGRATLAVADGPEFYARLEERGAQLQAGLERAARDARVHVQVPRQGSMLCVYFAEAPVTSFPEVLRTERARFPKFFHALRERGVLLPPSPFESWFLSSAHDEATIERVVAAAREAFAAC